MKALESLADQCGTPALAERAQLRTTYLRSKMPVLSLELLFPISLVLSQLWTSGCTQMAACMREMAGSRPTAPRSESPMLLQPGQPSEGLQTAVLCPKMHQYFILLTTTLVYRVNLRPILSDISVYLKKVGNVMVCKKLFSLGLITNLGNSLKLFVPQFHHW